jgi:hypothetical protein
LLDVVALATNLKSLRIYCSRFMDIDTLNIEKLKTLQVLDLCGVRMSADQLSSLVAQNRESLQTINLRFAELKSGTWTDVFAVLCQLPHVKNTEIAHSGYCANGESSHLALSLRSSKLDYSGISSKHKPDRLAVRNFESHVEDNRRRLKPPV